MKPIKEYECYSITKTGKVWSHINNRFLKPFDNSGYLRIRFKIEWYPHKSFLIHRLVATAFIPNPENKPQINHIDGNKLNNNVSNLEWATSKENNKHSYDTGLNKIRTGNDGANSKMIINTETMKIYGTITEACKDIGYHPSTVSCMLNGKKTKTVPLEYYIKP